MRNLFMGLLLLCYAHVLSAEDGKIHLEGDIQAGQTGTDIVVLGPLVVSGTIASDRISIECDTISGSGLIEAKRINILANTLFDFTGEIYCTDLCRIEAREFNGIFVAGGGGIFQIITIP